MPNMLQIVTELLITTELPSRPWEKVASDLYDFQGASYILVVDYFSRYIKMQKLSSTTSSSIIIALKLIFARHGIPDVVVTDNGPNTPPVSLKHLQHPIIFPILPAAHTTQWEMEKRKEQ